MKGDRSVVTDAVAVAIDPKTTERRSNPDDDDDDADGTTSSLPMD